MTASAMTGGTWTGHLRRWAPVIVLIGLCLMIGAFNANFFGISNIIRML